MSFGQSAQNQAGTERPKAGRGKKLASAITPKHKADAAA
jgi:hypothetical protein